MLAKNDCSNFYLKHLNLSHCMSVSVKSSHIFQNGTKIVSRKKAEVPDWKRTFYKYLAKDSHFQKIGTITTLPPL